MPTLRQRKVVAKLLEKPGSVSAAMREVGYADNTAHNPKDLTESKGFQELCDEVGLTDDFLTKALFEDIKSKKGNRKPELELGFKVRGRLKDPAPGGITNNLFVLSNGQAEKIAARLAANAGRNPSDGEAPG